MISAQHSAAVVDHLFGADVALITGSHSRTNSTTMTITTTTLRHGLELSLSQEKCSGAALSGFRFWQSELRFGDFTFPKIQPSTGSAGGNNPGINFPA